MSRIGVFFVIIQMLLLPLEPVLAQKSLDLLAVDDPVKTEAVSDVSADKNVSAPLKESIPNESKSLTESESNTALSSVEADSSNTEVASTEMQNEVGEVTGEVTIEENKIQDESPSISEKFIDIEDNLVDVIVETVDTITDVVGLKDADTGIEQMVKGGPDLSLYKAMDEINGVPFKVQDAFSDVAELPNGDKVYRFYAGPRPVKMVRNKLMEMAGGWNLFDEVKTAKLTSAIDSGYSFSLPLGQGKVTVKAGQVEYGKRKIDPRSEAFQSYTSDDLSRVSEYRNIYPGMTVRFSDSSLWRSREIIIEELPFGLERSDTLVFWESYILPEGGTVVDTEGKIIDSGTTTHSRKTLLIKEPGGLFVSVGGAQVFDATESDSTLEDLEQIVEIDYEKRTMRIGIELKADYLFDKTRVFPVTIDPIYYACDAGDWGGQVCSLNNGHNPDLTDLYLRYLGDRDASLPELWLGYYLAPDGPAPRMIVTKFHLDENSIPENEAVTAASLVLTFSRLGSGNYRGNVSTVARQIRTNWNEGNVRYSEIRGTLLTVSPNVNISTGIGADQEVSYDVLSAFTQWLGNDRSGNHENYGILVEPTPGWLNNDRPQWPNVQFRFRSSRHAQGRGPLLIVTAQALGPAPDPREPNNNSGQAVNIGDVGNFSDNNLNLTAGDEDWFRFNYNNQTYYFKVKGYTNNTAGDYNLSFNRNGNSVTIETRSRNGSNTDTYLFLYDTDARTELTSNDDIDGTPFSRISYNLPQPADPLEPNNSAAQATNIGDAGNYTNNQLFLTAGDEDWFRFNYNNQTYYFKVRGYGPNTAGNYNLIFNRNNNAVTIETRQRDGVTDTFLYLYSTDGVTQLDSDDDDGDDVFSLITYNLPLPVDPFELNNDAQEAWHIGGELQFSSNQTFLTAGDQDWFRFEYNNRMYYFKVVGYDPSIAGDYNLSFNRNNSEVIIETSSRNGSNTDTKLYLYDTDSVTELAYNDDTNGLFSRVVYTIQEPFTDNLEPNNSWQQATNIGDSVNYSHNGLGLAVGDEDWFRFEYNGRAYYFYVRGISRNTVGDYNLAFSRDAWTVTMETSRRTDMVDTVVQLNDSDGQSQLGYDDDHGDGLFSRLIYTFGYCNGCGGGGGGGGGEPPPPPPSAELPDVDADSFADVEEAFAGTNPLNAIETASLFDRNYPNYSSTIHDKVAQNDSADPVNTRTGSFELTQTDFSFKGRGVPINFVRSYNSMTVDKTSRIGNGWSFSHNVFYYQDPATQDAQIYLGGTLATIFTTDNGGETFNPPKGEFDKLYWNNANHEYLIYETLDATKYFFSRRLSSQLGILDFIRDRNGNETTFAYNVVRDVPLLTGITDPSGRGVSIAYGEEQSNDWDKIIQLRETANNQSPRIITYEYTDGNLFRVTSNRSYDGQIENIIQTYVYDGAGRLFTYTDPRGTILYNEYDGQGRVTAQYEHNPRVDAQGERRLVYTLAYSGADAQAPGSVQCTTTQNFRDNTANGAVHYDEIMCFDVNSLKIFTRNGPTTNTFSYDERGMVTAHTDGNGVITGYRYDARRRLVEETFPDTAKWHTVRSYVYEDTFNKLTSQTETATLINNPEAQPQTRTTQYEIDPANGNVLSLTDMLGHSERFVYDAFGNVLSRTDKNGAVTNYQYDAGGNFVAREAVSVTQSDGSQQDVVQQFEYDVYGNKTQYIDPRGLIYNYRYDAHGNLREARNPDNGLRTNMYDVESHRVQTVDELGRTTLYTYDTDINASLLSEERLASDGTRQTFGKAYDFVGNLISETDPMGREMRYVYDGANRVIQKIGPVNTITFTYDNDGRLIREIDLSGARTDYVYDSRGQIIEQRNFIAENSFVSSVFDYDGFGRRVSEMDGNGQTTGYEYDAMDNVLRKIDAAGSVYENVYDNAGNKIGERTPRAVADGNLRNAQGYSASFFYDAAGRLTKEVNALNKETLYLYDANGNVVSHTDRRNADGSAGNHLTRSVYDNLNRKITETFADGGTAQYVYDAAGRLVSRQDQMGRIWTNAYNDYDDLVSELDPAGNATRYGYDSAGNKISVIYPDNTQTRYGYDAGNRLMIVSDAIGGVKTFAYDAAGNKVSETDKLNHTTRFVYDLAGRLVQETNPQGTITVYVYDANGNRIIERVGAKATAYVYDELSRVTRIVYPGDKTERYVYDADGNKTQFIDGNNHTTNFRYDALNRAIEKRAQDRQDGYPLPVLYEYDNWGNAVSVASFDACYMPVCPEGMVCVHMCTVLGDTRTQYTFDVMNRSLTETLVEYEVENGEPEQITRFTVSRTYNADGSLASLMDVAGRVMSYEYNNRGLLQSVNYNNQALGAYTYNTFGKPSGIAYANGVRTGIIYDGLERAQSIEMRGADGAVLFRQDYEYDAQSNRRRMVENGDRVITYGYDNLDQLMSVDYENIGVGSDITFAYDIYGNRTGMTTPFGATAYTYSADSNELQEVVRNGRLSVRSVFDGNGSLASETYTRLGRPDMEVSYAWETQNRLSSITYARTGGRPAYMPALPSNRLEFKYDDAGNRIRKIVNGQVTRYVNDGISVLNELDANYRAQKTIARGLDTVAEIDADGVITFVHQDVLGSAVMLTNAVGAVVKRYEYDPFGLTTGESGGTEDTKYLFTGQEYDPESELYYYNARYYNPRLGRFISRDRVLGRDGDSLSRNGYIYVKNNPLKYVDPTGNDVEESWGRSLLNNFVDQALFTGGVGVGAVKGLWSTTKSVGTAIIHPIDTVKDIGSGLWNLGTSAWDYAGELYSDPSKTLDDTWSGISNWTVGAYNDFQSKSPYEQGEAIGFGAEKVAEIIAVSKGLQALKANSVTTVFRVEGATNTKILIDELGNVEVIAKTKPLYLNFGDKSRAVNFFQQKVEGGMPNTKIKSFEVPKSFVDDLDSAAVSETDAGLFPNSPFRVDVTKASNQFGLRRQQIDQLKNAIIKGSGKDVTDYLLNLFSKKK